MLDFVDPNPLQLLSAVTSGSVSRARQARAPANTLLFIKAWGTAELLSLSSVHKALDLVLGIHKNGCSDTCI